MPVAERHELHTVVNWSLPALLVSMMLGACSDKAAEPSAAAAAAHKEVVAPPADAKAPVQAAAVNAGGRCNWMPLRERICEMIPASLAAQVLGVDEASIEQSDNRAAMASSPQFLSCTYSSRTDRAAGSVNVGQIEASTVAAFQAMYKVQDAAAIEAGMGKGVALAEKTTGSAVEGDRLAKARAEATEIVKGLQYGRVDGLGDRAASMYSGQAPMAYLITLVGKQKFVVKVRKGQQSREQNLDVAKVIAADIVGRCS